MPERVQMHRLHVQDVDIHVLFPFTPSFPIDEAGDFEAEFSTSAGVLDGITINGAGIDDMEGIIDHRRGAFGARFDDLGTAFGILVE